MDTEAYDGSYRTNTFYFKHYILTQVGVYVDGEQIPRKRVFLNFDAAVIAGFQSLFSGIGKLSQDTGNRINRNDYGSGYTLFAFDLTPDHCPEDHFELIKQETDAWSFISRKHSPTRLTLSSTLNFKT